MTLVALGWPVIPDVEGDSKQFAILPGNGMARARMVERDGNHGRRNAHGHGSDHEGAQNRIAAQTADRQVEIMDEHGTLLKQRLTS